MSLEHVSTFRVRHYECDALGHFNNANYLRYVHDARTEALDSVAVGPDSRPLTSGRWQASEVFVDYLRVLKAGDVVRVRATVVDLQRDRALWAYEFQEDGSQQASARAQIAYLFQDRVEGQTLPFPTEVRQALQQSHDGGRPGREVEFPNPPPQPPGALGGSWEVEWRDVDEDWCLKTAAYLEYFTEFITRASADLGWTQARYLDAGVIWIIKRQWLRILKPARQGDRLRMTTWLSPLKRVRAVRHYTAHRQGTGEPVCEAHVLWVSIDPDSGRPIPMPASFVRDFAPQVAVAEG